MFTSPSMSSDHHHSQSLSDSETMDFDSDSDSDSRMSMDLFSVGSSRSSATTQRHSMSSGNSVYSVSSSIRAQVYRHEYGRGLNNYSEVYQLPADDDEFQRLDKQHIVVQNIWGRYPPPMYEIMADPGPGGEIVTCLDLGCGSGSWILEVARDFPHSSCVAVDLVPMQAESLPPNCRSEMDDINLGLQHFYGDFNVVHCRLICSGVKDYEGLIDQCSMILRPAGLLDVKEFDFLSYGHDHRPLIAEEAVLQPPWLGRWMSLCRTAISQRGGDVDAANHLYRWISNHDAFEDVVYRPVYIPASPFLHPDEPDAQFWNNVGAAMRDDVQEFLRSSKPLLLGHGLSQIFVDELEKRARRELQEAKIRQYVFVHAVYARKRQ